MDVDKVGVRPRVGGTRLGQKEKIEYRETLLKLGYICELVWNLNAGATSWNLYASDPSESA